MYRSRIALVAAGVLIAGSLVACGSSGGGSSTKGSASSGGSYRVGFDSDLSGPYALNGVGQKDGFQAYFDYINAHGGINGHQVNVTYLDDAADVTRGTANTTQLMTAKKVSVIGGYILSNVCGAAAVLAAKNKVPINCSAVSDDLLHPVQPYVYTARMSQSNEAAPESDLAAQLVTSSAPKVAIIIFASAASVSLQKGLQSIAKNKGWNVVANESIPLNSTDVSSQVAKIVAAKPDVIMGSLFDPLAVSFVRGIRAKSLDAPFIDYDGATYKSGLLGLKDPNFYVLSSTTMDGTGDGAGLTQYRAAIKAGGFEASTPFVNTGYLQALSIGEGLKSCGYPCSGAQLQAALDKQSVDTGGFASGTLGYTPDRHEGLQAVSLYVWDPATSGVKVALKDAAGGNGSS
ncbi:MAG TPA: ABC transporter substrate-binding protein [Jatrophihabitantaceae bacterium]|jgi:ABC-type branched-subunit amino acid transport system substrate-binding protein